MSDALNSVKAGPTVIEICEVCGRPQLPVLVWEGLLSAHGVFGSTLALFGGYCGGYHEDHEYPEKKVLEN